ncbi:hypothetical protein ACFE04_020904 [Oxalis oulophora]
MSSTHSNVFRKDQSDPIFYAILTIILYRFDHSEREEQGGTHVYQIQVTMPLQHVGVSQDFAGGRTHKEKSRSCVRRGILLSNSPQKAITLANLEHGGSLTTSIESVQYFGRKKTVVAVTHCKRGRGLIKINGVPIELVVPEILRFKAVEPILLLDRHRFARVDMRIRVKGGGHTSQIYAIRQSITKALVAFYQKDS